MALPTTAIYIDVRKLIKDIKYVVWFSFEVALLDGRTGADTESSLFEKWVWAWGTRRRESRRRKSDNQQTTRESSFRRQ